VFSTKRKGSEEGKEREERGDKRKRERDREKEAANKKLAAFLFETFYRCMTPCFALLALEEDLGGAQQCSGSGGWRPIPACG
jgi:hypothetical protein